MAERRQKKAQRRLTEGYKWLREKVRATMPVSYAVTSYVLEERRYRETNADTGLVTVTGRRSS